MSSRPVAAAPREGADRRLPDGVVRLFVCGDVMLGRGVDQILPSPGDPELREGYVTDARRYVELAEEVNGPIPREVDPAWPWGEALAALEAAAPDVRIINLETSITRSDRFAPGKAVHYRMSPDNLSCLEAVDPDVCTLANNHVLDLGPEGLEETLEVLDAAGLRTAGAGHDMAAAWRPAEVPLDEGGRVLVFSIGAPSSGIPPWWAASSDRPGVAALSDRLDTDARAVLDRIQPWRQAGDRVVVSIHWGSNWGYDVPREQTRFAHALIDGGVDVVHGHSSHHPRPIEVYRDRPILYGCGDLINDYEGIGGHEAYRSDLRLLYLLDLDRHTGGLVRLRMLPMQARQLRLHTASPSDTEWLRSTLDRTSRPLGTRIVLAHDGQLSLDQP
ncbi:MAG: CapA family protein [Nitriliruptor sp.]|nr:MAG: CapA family protein [Nitriliruptor sp.]